MHAIQRKTATLRTVKQRCFTSHVCAKRLSADKVSCGAVAIPSNTPGCHASMIIRTQHDVTTTSRAIERKKNHRIKSATAHSCHRIRLLTNPITQEAMHYSITYRQNHYWVCCVSCSCRPEHTCNKQTEYIPNHKHLC